MNFFIFFTSPNKVYIELLKFLKIFHFNILFLFKYKLISSKSTMKINMPENMTCFHKNSLFFLEHCCISQPNLRIVSLHYKDPLPQDPSFGVQKENEFLTVVIRMHI